MLNNWYALSGRWNRLQGHANIIEFLLVVCIPLQMDCWCQVHISQFWFFLHTFENRYNFVQIVFLSHCIFSGNESIASHDVKFWKFWNSIKMCNLWPAIIKHYTGVKMDSAGQHSGVTVTRPAYMCVKDYWVANLSGADLSHGRVCRVQLICVLWSVSLDCQCSWSVLLLRVE